MNETTNITPNVKVNVLEQDGQFEVRIYTNWFPNIRDWNLDETIFPIKTCPSLMSVYGFIEYEVKPAYIE